jgi:hypothetical protein
MNRRCGPELVAAILAAAVLFPSAEAAGAAMGPADAGEASYRCVRVSGVSISVSLWACCLGLPGDAAWICLKALSLYGIVAELLRPDEIRSHVDVAG